VCLSVFECKFSIVLYCVVLYSVAVLTTWRQTSPSLVFLWAV